MSSPAPVDRAAFRRLMGRWATGVTVVSARHADVDVGLTVNGFLSISLHPPSVLVSLMRDVDSLPIIERSGRFGVSVLAADQRALSVRFAETLAAPEKFRGVPVHRAPHGTPLLDGALGALECRVVARHSVFDHELLAGEVEYLELGPDGLPLVFFRSVYGETEAPDRVRLPPGRA